MKLHVDKEADARYLRLDDSTIVESEDIRREECLIATRQTISARGNALPLETLLQSESLCPGIRHGGAAASLRSGRELNLW